MLDCRIAQANVDLDRMDDFELRLPGLTEFSRSDLSGDKKQEIEKVESERGDEARDQD